MKVFLKYEDNDDSQLHKTLKITLPKSWKNGPTSKLLTQFVESYNDSVPAASSSGDADATKQHQLRVEDLHLAVRKESDGSTTTSTILGNNGNDESGQFTALASDAITVQVIPDRADVFVMHGPSPTVAELQGQQQKEEEAKKEVLAKNAHLVNCTHFGCKKRFPRGGPYPAPGTCSYHRLPPVFHETAKYWACCPNKKAYDWNDFENIPGCMTGTCTDVKEDDGQKQFLGGTDLREETGEGAKLKSIDDFNQAQAAGGTDAAPVLQRLRSVLADLEVENELFDQVINGMKALHGNGGTDVDDPANEAIVLDAVAEELGKKLKASFKAIAVEQLRIK